MTSSIKKQQLIGTVVSDKMAKTLVVRVDLRKRHFKYHKTFKVSKRFKAHDDTGEYHVGDKVVIESCRPISKDKKFKVISKA
ncbi:MAG: 30S ribosomal protein S17 [Patescibacteria group bacterium]|nr:30S ribosomal protein S17 [Patescibacteria group bacterium]